MYDMNTYANPQTKENILWVMANSEGRAKYYVDLFSNCDFTLVRSSTPDRYRIWVSQYDNITILVWERGTILKNWVAKIQYW